MIKSQNLDLLFLSSRLEKKFEIEISIFDNRRLFD